MTARKRTTSLMKHREDQLVDVAESMVNRPYYIGTGLGDINGVLFDIRRLMAAYMLWEVSRRDRTPENR